MDSLALATVIPRAIIQPPRLVRWASLKSPRNGPLGAYLPERLVSVVRKTGLNTPIPRRPLSQRRRVREGEGRKRVSASSRLAHDLLEGFSVD